MKRIFLIIGLLASINCFGQNEENKLKSTFRTNLFLFPGLELEVPISKKSTLAANTGVGIQGGYKNLDYTNSGFNYYIAPYLDLSYKKIYNRDSRALKNKNLDYNSGNYWGVRLLTNFKEFESRNLLRKDDISFVLGPIWGIQRAYGKKHFLFELGPVYYFDASGNGGFFPLTLDLKFGFNLFSWR